MKFPGTPTLIGMVQKFKTDPALKAAPLFPVAQSLTDSYEFDVIAGNRTIANYTLPDGAAGVTATRVRTRKKVSLPTLREKKMLKESTLRWLDAPGQKQPGRAEAEIAEELMDLDQIIERTHEYVRWQLLTSGQVDVTIEGTTETYDFGIGSTADASTTWDTVGSSDPVGDIVAWKESVMQACGEAPTRMFIGSQALAYMMESTKAQALLGDSTKDQYAASGVVRRLAEMDVVVVDDGYRDGSDEFKYFLSDDGVAANMLVMTAGSTVGVTAEGPPNDSKAPSGVVGKFAKSWEQEDPAGRWVLETHTALPGLTKPNYVGAFTLW